MAQGNKSSCGSSSTMDQSSTQYVECLLCNQHFPNQHTFRKHLQMESDYVPFQCSLCGEREDTEIAIMHHIQSEHSRCTDKKAEVINLRLQPAEDLLEVFASLCVLWQLSISSSQLKLLETKFLVAKRNFQLDDFDEQHYQVLLAKTDSMEQVFKDLEAHVTGKAAGAVNSEPMDDTSGHNDLPRSPSKKESRNNPCNVPTQSTSCSSKYQSERKWVTGKQETIAKKDNDAKCKQLAFTKKSGRKIRGGKCKPETNHEGHCVMATHLPKILGTMEERFGNVVYAVQHVGGISCKKCNANMSIGRYRWQTMFSHVLRHGPPGVNQKPFGCKLCGNLYMTFTGWKNHMTNFHRVLPSRAHQELEDLSGSTHWIQLFWDCFGA